ncbi:MAG: aspartate aminotransferase family protein [Candidatus Sericytochromatia bacterium]
MTIEHTVPASLSRKEIVDKHKEYMLPSIGQLYADPLPFVKGEGFYLTDADGKQYLDFFGGIVTVSVGHCDPEITERVVAQMRTLQHTSTLFPIEAQARLAEKMAQITPGKLKKSFFTNSGSEANEKAIQLAQAHTGRRTIVSLRHAYSGGTAGAATVTAHHNWRIGEPNAFPVAHAKNPYCYRCPFGKTPSSCSLECVKDLEETIQSTTDGQIAAFMAEPIQGVGGFIVPPKEYFKEAVAVAKKYGGVFIADEVQTGFGRTGNQWFGIQQYGVDPDLMTGAKGIANGMPMGFVIATDEVATALNGKVHLNTFGGNPISSTAALATIEAMEGRALPQNAFEVGNYLHDRLKGLQDKYPMIGDVRGMGLMQALELVKDRETKEPYKEMQPKLVEAAREQGLIIGKGGLYGNVIRMSPPMSISRTEVDMAIEMLDRAFAAIS